MSRNSGGAASQAARDLASSARARLGFNDLSTSAGVAAARNKLMNRGSSSGGSSVGRTVTMSATSQGVSGGGGGSGSSWKNLLINKVREGGVGSLSQHEKRTAQSVLSPEEYGQYFLGQAPAVNNNSSGGGGSIDANSLMELYQKGLGAGGGASTDDQIRLLREGNNLDLQRKRAEQDMQMEGQKQALSQAQEARAKERETEATLQRRQQSTERSNAMAAYKGL